MIKYFFYNLLILGNYDAKIYLQKQMTRAFADFEARGSAGRVSCGVYGGYGGPQNQLG